MIEIDIKCEIDRTIQDLTHQFSEFEKVEDKLPLFLVTIYEGVPDEIQLSHYLKYTVNGYRYYKTENSYYIYYDITDAYKYAICMSDSFEKVAVYYNKMPISMGSKPIGDLLYQGYRYRAAVKESMMIHAVATIYKDECILFCGMHAAGKSTQANLWVKYLNAWILNGDTPCIVTENNSILVNGSPWSGKENVYINKYAPLKAIVFVEKATVNHVQKVSNREGFSLVYLNNYLIPINTELEKAYQDLIKKIVCKVPVYRLSCTISEEAVKVVYEEIYSKSYRGRYWDEV